MGFILLKPIIAHKGLLNFRIMKHFIFIIICLTTLNTIAQGPYAPAAGQPGSTAIHKDSTVFADWAVTSTVNFGWMNIADTSQGRASTGNTASATGFPGTNGVVSLGDSGYVTLTFNGVLYDGIGADFAVFENGFGSFLELAFVEVSSDGINFYRFDAVSLTDTSTQTGGFGSTDPTNLYNIAGKYVANYGTPFDLNELSGILGLDINAITHVRIVDVIGSVNSAYASYDSQNRAVNDPWPTPFATGGFDLDAVGAINITTSVEIEEFNSNNISLFPNPANNVLNIHFPKKEKYSVYVQSINGKTLITKSIEAQSSQLNLSDLDAGIYFVNIQSNTKTIVKRIVKQ